MLNNAVIEKPQVYIQRKFACKILKENRWISLTFDDGPHEVYTPIILDILKEFNVKAAFFVVGKNIEKYPEIMERIVREGHDVGNHTYSHPVSPILNYKKMEHEIKITDKIIKEIAGKEPVFFRPTWLPWDIHAKKMAAFAQGFVYPPIRWSISTLDWLGMKSIIEGSLLKNEFYPGEIFLFHDGAEKTLFKKRNATIELLPKILKKFKQKNFTPVTLSRLFL